MTDKLIPLITGFLTALCAFWVYYRLFRGTGLTFGMIGSGALGVFSFFSPTPGRLLAFILFSIGMVFELIVNTQKRQYAHSQYIYEGGGVRRGLIPMEVGVLFNFAINDLVVLALIDLLQKEYVTYTTLPEGGIFINLADDYKSDKIILNPKLRRKSRNEIAFSKLKELTKTEDVLLELISKNVDRSLGSYSIQPWIDYLHRQVNHKLSGYEIDQTRNYYQNFVRHRLHGVAEGHFEPPDYYGWMAFGRFLNEELSELALGVMKNSHPDWIPEGESFINWVLELRSIAW